MCGLSGFVNLASQPKEVSLDNLKDINNRAKHRGPDAEGYFNYENVFLGHRRLAIIDLNENAKQPMNYLDRYVIIFNGMLYNYIELRSELIGLGHSFKTDSDTEVVLAAYAQWKEHAFVKFNGMWAIVILDKHLKKLIFSRDRFGEKPLYYFQTDDRIVFASEIKQLVPELNRRRVNERILLDYMFSRQENFNKETFFQDIYSFLPGSISTLSLTDDTSKIKFSKYYDLQDAVNDRLQSNQKHSAEDFIDQFHESIKLRLRSDVSNGILLSGGVDSSGIAIAAHQISQEKKSKLHYFHAKSFQESNDESAMASALAKHLNVSLSINEPSQDEFSNMLDDLAYSQDEPYGGPSMLMSFSIYQFAKKNGMKVMLGGQGADEILFGYERYIASLSPIFNFFTLPSLIQSGRKHSLSALNSLKHLLYFRYYPVRYLRLKKNSYLKKEFISSGNMETLKNTVSSFKDQQKMQISEITAYQLPHLLRYEDRNSMAHSIESRLPFLESNLVELALSLPLDVKTGSGWSKKVLRDYLSKAGAKQHAWSRKKIGFEAPEKFWREHKKELILREVSGSKILNKYCNLDNFILDFDSLSLHEIWPYFSVATWERVFDVEI